MVTFAFSFIAGLMLLTLFFDTPLAMAVRDSTMLIAIGVERVASAFVGLGLLGAVAATLLYALGSMIAFPASLMTFAAVLAFGYAAILVTGIGAFIGLALSFLIARRFFRQHMNWFCMRYPVTRGIERAVSNNGFWLVLLMRQSPIIPFAAQNYMFGMLQTKTRDYMLASGLGIIPGTIAKVYVFESARSIAGGSLPPWQIALSVIGIAATIAVMVLIGRYVRRELATQTL